MLLNSIILYVCIDGLQHASLRTGGNILILELWNFTCLNRQIISQISLASMMPSYHSIAAFLIINTSFRVLSSNFERPLNPKSFFTANKLLISGVAVAGLAVG